MYVISVITEMDIIPRIENLNISFAQYKCLSVAPKSQTVTNSMLALFTNLIGRLKKHYAIVLNCRKYHLLISLHPKLFCRLTQRDIMSSLEV